MIIIIIIIDELISASFISHTSISTGTNCYNGIRFNVR